MKFKVRFTESERGWGQKSWYNYYNTFKQAQAAIKKCNEENEADWNRTHVVPDYYIQCDDKIVAVEKEGE